SDSQCSPVKARASLTWVPMRSLGIRTTLLHFLRCLRPNMPDPLLLMHGISKRFGATQALRDVSLRVEAGRVMALIGENGAGKSTLMKILSGAHRPDAGEMRFNGRAYQPNGPQAARQAGVAIVY